MRRRPNASVFLQRGTRPRAEDVACVLEVAGTSLERDRSTKLRHYAAGGIPQYVILNLAERTAEEYQEPDPAAATYAKRTVHAADDVLRLRLAGEERLEVPLGQLFPAR